MTDAPKMTREHIDDVLEAMGSAQSSAVRYQRYAKARQTYLARAARLAEVAAFLRSHTDEP